MQQESQIVKRQRSTTHTGLSGRIPAVGVVICGENTSCRRTIRFHESDHTLRHMRCGWRHVVGAMRCVAWMMAVCVIATSGCTPDSGRVELSGMGRYGIGLIVRSGRIVDMASVENFYPLHTAAESGAVETIEAMVAAGLGVDRIDLRWQTPLAVAAAAGEVEAVKALLRLQAEPKYKDDMGYTPVDHAVWNGHDHVARLLEQHGADMDIFALAGLGDMQRLKAQLTPENVHVRDRHRRTLLHWAAAGDQREVAKILMTMGADLDAKDIHGWTPLAASLANDGVGACAKLFISKGADLDKVPLTVIGRALVEEADDRVYARPEDIEYLLDAGANADAEPGNGMTPLFAAVLARNAEIVSALLARGADPNAPSLGWSPLHLAAGYGRVDIVQLLLAAGAAPNVQTGQGDTPLHSAVDRSTESIDASCHVVKLLLKHGADPTIRNAEGLLPADVALKWGNDSAAALLRPTAK